MFGEVKNQKLEVELPQMILGCTADKIRDGPTHFLSNYTGNYTSLHLYHISLHILRQTYIHIYPTLDDQDLHPALPGMSPFLLNQTERRNRVECRARFFHSYLCTRNLLVY